MSRRQKSTERSRARAETQKEAQESFVAPQAGLLYPEPSAKGIALAVPLFALFGAVIVLPFAFFEFADLSTATRFTIAAVLGAVAGSVVGLVVGPSMGARMDAKRRAGSPEGSRGRPGKAEVAEATGESERPRPRSRKAG